MNDETTYIRLNQASPIPLDVEFSCRNGEIFVLVGPSGSGKTTTLRSIAGLYKPDSGKVICNGKTWYDTDMKINIPVQQRAVGMVFQHYALFPHLSVRDNITLAITGKNAVETLSRVTGLISTVHLDGLEDRYPHKLSGGQQQRVALARALAREPDMLLLDEPFSAVDQQVRRHLVRELVQLRNRINIPIIHVTHNLNEARRIADTLCIMDDGETLQLGPPDEVMSHPASARVAVLTGHDNIFSATIHAQDQINGKTYIKWHEHVLTTKYQPGFNADETIDWMIPSSHFKLHRGNDRQTEARDNIVEGRITEYIQLGEGSSVTVMVDGTGQELYMTVSSDVARAAGFNPGSNVKITLPPDSIHLMAHTVLNTNNK